MADLVIRGMEKPIDCHSCWMRVYCFERGIGVWGCGKGKPCPIVPLPEGHGRLIDADALRDDWLHNGANEFVYDANTVIYSIDDATAIVPAEGEDE